MEQIDRPLSRLLLGVARFLDRRSRALRDLAAHGTTDARTEWERRFLDVRSFEGAERCLWALYSPLAILQEDHSQQAREALSLAAVIVYAQPFTQQRDGVGRREPPSFRKFYLKALDREPHALHPSRSDKAPEKALHERLMRVRSQFYAHRDAQAARLTPAKDFNGGVLQEVRELSERDARASYKLAVKLGGLAEERRSFLGRQLA